MSQSSKVLFAPADAPGAARTLEELEGIIAKGLPTDDQIALALLEIHDRKLYHKEYGTFQAYLRRRWQFSRSRGYQILHFARLLEMSTTVGTSGPQTERQARLLNRAGKPRRPRETDVVTRAMNYLVAAYEKLPLLERRDFVESLQSLLFEMHEQVEKHLASPAGSSGTSDNPSSKAHP